MRREYFAAVILGVLLAVAGTVPALAQQAATVAGSVTDESKGVLPGVTVTATETSSGRQYTAVTDERGEYRLTNVQPGTYRLQAELTGFAPTVLPELELLVGQSVTVPLILKLGTLQESVTVSGDAPLVDTRSTQVAGNIDRRQMEELPISGRNWMELSMMVKGVTSNDVTVGRPGTARDDQFQLNLDGQQITQLVAGTSSFGQPGLSREAIAEFQIVTNLFDVTQGRSVGLTTQAISRSGTNNLSGSFYGYFRSDKLNAADPVAKVVLPFSNQQTGGSIGGPIARDRTHYFATYEYEREPNTWVLQPPGYTSTISLPTKRTQHRLLARGDHQISGKDRLMVRYTHYYDIDPFGGFSRGERGGGQYPTDASKLGRDNWAVNSTWTRVLTSTLVQELKGGFFYYHWHHIPAIGVPLTPRYDFPGLSIGARSNYPEEFWQHNPSIRYDLSWHKGAHDFKFGAEHLRDRHTGWWQNVGRGVMTMGQLPADIERRFPLDAWQDPSRWDFSGLDPLAISYRQFFAREGEGAINFKGNCPNPAGCGDWSLDIPRYVTAFWVGDTWRMSDRLTVNMGVRYDVDPGALAPPLVRETDVVINNGLFTDQVGYDNDVKDWNNWSPRGGFNLNVREDGSLVVRGGTGVYYSAPLSNVTFNQQLFNGQRVLANFWNNDGRPGFVTDPTRGVTGDDIVEGRVPLPAQAVFVFSREYQLPTVWTSLIGVQKQLGEVMAFDSDLVYEKGTSLGSVRDPNLFYDPVTGYNLHATRVGRPRRDYGNINFYESTGYSEGLQLANSFTRRYRNNWQAGVTYTLMFFRKDTGTGSSGYAGTRENHFDLDLDQQFGRAADFQRHTLRANGIVRLPWEMSLSGAYFFGSGNYFQSTYPHNPFGSGAGARRRPDGSVIPVRDFKGDPIHKVDLRLTKDLRLVGNVRLQGIAEVFNLLNRANFGAYNTVETRSNYGLPTQHLGTMFWPRTGQLAFRLTF